MTLINKGIDFLKRESVGYGDTVKLAQEDACKLLNADEKDMEFEIIQLPEKKKFGLFGGKQAKVIARLKNPVLDYTLSNLKATLNCLSKNNIDIKAENNDNGATFYLSGDGVSDILKLDNELLMSIQYIMGLMSSQKNESYYNIKIRAKEIDQNRRERLKNIVNEAVEKVRKTKKEVKLGYMNSYERKIVHEFVQEHEGMISYSEGEKPNRHVIIKCGSK